MLPKIVDTLQELEALLDAADMRFLATETRTVNEDIDMGDGRALVRLPTPVQTERGTAYNQPSETPAPLSGLDDGQGQLNTRSSEDVQHGDKK